MSLREKTCVVTGASSGIGRRVAQDLARSGGRLCAVARRGELLTALVEELGGSSAGHTAFAADVADRNQVRALARHVSDTYGRCDVLINNAGFSHPGRFTGPVDIARVEEIMATNFGGVVNCTGELLPLLRASAPSTIVNVSSMAGRVGFPGATGYCASKFAVTGFSEALRAELDAEGVNVAHVDPGLVSTEGFPFQRAQRHPVLRLALVGEDDVSAAIIDAISHRRSERTVPRWYYLVALPKIMAPGLFARLVARAPSWRRLD